MPYELNPHGNDCSYHFKSQILLEGHVCGGLQEPKDTLSIAMRHANNLLAKLHFTIRGAINQASSMFQVERFHLPALNPTFTLAGHTQERTCILS